MTAMDYLTMWLEVYAILNQKSSMVADVLVTNFFCHFRVLRVLRVLRELHSKQGQNSE
jgi:hypothetical protein